MIKVGITGQYGFVGQHLYQTLALLPEQFELVDFHRDFFSDTDQLVGFVSKCNVIVHLAALNRHDDPHEIYSTNKSLVEKLIAALESCDSKAHVVFSSSSQEGLNNLYGDSKKEGRELLFKWAEESGGKFSGLIIPNVFGPFGKPNYNSFIATFCFKLIHNIEFEINLDTSVKLIYVGELVKFIIETIKTSASNHLVLVPHNVEYKVSNILALLKNFQDQYFLNGVIPKLDSLFEVYLFNTFRSYIDIENHYPLKFKQHVDSRGKFVELIRLNVGGQVSFSTTMPGVTRGNHFHTRKIERFAVIKGNALIQLRKIGSKEVFNFELCGDDAAFVDMPVWYTHNIKNIGPDELYTVFWINEFFDEKDPDTFMEIV